MVFAQKWYLGSDMCKNDSRLLLEVVAKQWHGAMLVQEVPKTN
jgi:hypothetical protein